MIKKAMTCIVIVASVSIVYTTQGSAEPTRDEGQSMRIALEQFRKADYETAIKSLQDILSLKTPKARSIEEYVRFYLAQSYLKTRKLDEADKELQRVLKMSPNVKLSIEASNLLGQVALEKKNFKQARAHFIKLERRTRNTEDYPDVIFNLAGAEKGLGSHSSMCKWLTKLYEKYPAYAKVKDWSHDLAANDFLGKPTDCQASVEDFRTRVRYLLWAGLDQKAQSEINVVKEDLAKIDRYSADKLQAQFYIQDGEITKSVEILKPYYDSNKRNFDYLILFASAAARAGEVQLAVGSYYLAYKLNPKSKTGRQALYQSAFLSYQFQDYDGASRRFQEFMKVYPGSGLNRDAQWHMAWLKYLKGDYDGSYKAFAKLNQQKRKNRRGGSSFPQDRVSYWMAMSLLRQGKIDQARPLFSTLAKDPLLGYYSVAAQARLQKIGEGVVTQTHISSLPTQPRVISRFSASEFLMPEAQQQYYAEENESEDNLVLTQYSAEDEESSQEADEAGSSDNPDMKSVEVAHDGIQGDGVDGDNAPVFANQVLAERLERARIMTSIGERDWARWDLYDIERRTSKKDYLRILMSEYSAVEYFNRSSYISQINFGAARAVQGLTEGRALWEFAYPKAFDQHVSVYTKKFQVPSELVWGIMRAETHYRKDAISPVGALGLMQVMPFTGHKLAALLGEKNFAAPNLLQPETSVRYGSRYLKRLMDRFDNTIPLVAAGYNAGPHRVKNWLISFGTLDTDEFIEHIPFLETRNYVKRVVSNTYIYGQLYGKKENLFPYMAGALPVKPPKEIVGKENWDDI